MSGPALSVGSSVTVIEGHAAGRSATVVRFCDDKESATIQFVSEHGAPDPNERAKVKVAHLRGFTGGTSLSAPRQRTVRRLSDVDGMQSKQTAIESNKVRVVGRCPALR